MKIVGRDALLSHEPIGRRLLPEMSFLAGQEAELPEDFTIDKAQVQSLMQILDVGLPKNGVNKISCVYIYIVCSACMI